MPSIPSRWARRPLRQRHGLARQRLDGDGELHDHRSAEEQVFAWSKLAYNSAGWYLTSESDASPLVLSVGPASGQPYKVAVDTARAGFFPTGQWTHVVVTYDKATKAVHVLPQRRAPDLDGEVRGDRHRDRRLAGREHDREDARLQRAAVQRRATPTACSTTTRSTTASRRSRTSCPSRSRATRRSIPPTVAQSATRRAVGAHERRRRLRVPTERCNGASITWDVVRPRRHRDRRRRGVRHAARDRPTPR